MSVQVTLPSLHPGQQRIEDHPARHKMLRCGRRYGKTKYGITKAAKTALEGGKVGWFAPTFKYTQEAWRELVRRLRPVAELEGGRISEQDKRIELPSGGTIEIWTIEGNEDPARGRDYDLVIIDEAGLVGNLSTLWEAAIEPTLIDREGKSLFLGTPKGARTPFNVMFAEAEMNVDPEWAAFHGKTVHNTTIRNVEEKIAKAKLRAERRGTLPLFYQEYEGVPADDGSNPIGLNAIRAVVAEASKHPTVAWGVDLARAVDYTVVTGLDALGQWTEQYRFQHDWGPTKRKLLEICGTSLPVVMDSTGVGSPIVDDLQNAGMNVEGFVFSRKSRGTLIEDLITAIHGKRLTIPGGITQAELESLGIERNSETNFTKYTVPDGMHDDCIMSLALAWRCYSYYADSPDWRPEKRELPWLADEDGTRILESDADAEFSGLGDGW